LPIDRPPANDVIVDAAVNMIESGRSGLDDLFKMDLKQYATKIKRLEVGLDMVKGVIEAAVRAKIAETANSARGDAQAEEFWT
jgi:hypothetical protein